MKEPHLTKRERQVADLIVEGLSDKEIGARLGVTPHTAGFHVDRLRKKLGVDNRVKAAVAIIQRRQGHAFALLSCGHVISITLASFVCLGEARACPRNCGGTNQLPTVSMVASIDYLRQVGMLDRMAG